MAIYHGNSYNTANCVMKDLELVKKQIELAQDVSMSRNADGSVYITIYFWENDTGWDSRCCYGDEYTYSLTAEEYQILIEN